MKTVPQISPITAQQSRTRSDEHQNHSGNEVSTVTR
jgi:hypothetical protein